MPTIRKTFDDNQWLRDQIAARWPQTTKDTNGGVYLTVALANMVLSGAVGLDHEQVTAKLDAMRMTHRPLDQYPGHAKIRESLASLQDATRSRGSALPDARVAAVVAALQSAEPLIRVEPGEPEATPYTAYWLDRAARVLLYREHTVAAPRQWNPRRCVGPTGSPQDVHLWHAWASKPPEPSVGDPKFFGDDSQFLGIASAVCEHLGRSRVRKAVDGRPLFDGTPLAETSEVVRFYQHQDLREMKRTSMFGIAKLAHIRTKEQQR